MPACIYIYTYIKYIKYIYIYKCINAFTEQRAPPRSARSGISTKPREMVCPMRAPAS